MFSLKYSLFCGLIDGFAFLMYNSRMEQKEPHIIYTERNTPKRAVIRSDGALYAVLLLGTFLMIVLAYRLTARFGINRLYVQIGLYAALLGIGYLIYRVRLIEYVYELTEDTLIIQQAVGKRQKVLVSVPFSAIRDIGPYSQTGVKREPRTYHGRSATTTAIRFERNGEERVVLLRASDTLKEKLAEVVSCGKRIG